MISNNFILYIVKEMLENNIKNICIVHGQDVVDRDHL